jgi:hypothetical protein
MAKRSVHQMSVAVFEPCFLKKKLLPETSGDCAGHVRVACRAAWRCRIERDYQVGR